MKKIKTFEEFLLELETTEIEVVLFPGRFQPVHLGHLAAWEKCHKNFGVPVVPIQILSKNAKSPFSEDLLEKIRATIVSEYNWIENFVVWKQGVFIPDIMNYLESEFGYKAIGMGCGSDRYKSYEPQVKKINSGKYEVNLEKPFVLEICDERSDDGISGTKVREALQANDRKTFEKMTPKCLHKFYEDLRKQIST